MERSRSRAFVRVWRRRTAWLHALAGLFALLGCADDVEPSDADGAPSSKSDSTGTQTATPQVAV